LSDDARCHLVTETFRRPDRNMTTEVGCFRCNKIVAPTSLIKRPDVLRNVTRLECPECHTLTVIDRPNSSIEPLSRTLGTLHSIFFPGGQEGRFKLLS
jgi:hypothetical protein